MLRVVRARSGTRIGLGDGVVRGSRPDPPEAVEHPVEWREIFVTADQNRPKCVTDIAPARHADLGERSDGVLDSAGTDANPCRT